MEENKESFVMIVEVEIECKKCGTKKIIGIPVSCKPDIQVKGEALVCDLFGETEKYLPKCECGKKEYQVKKEKVKIVEKKKIEGSKDLKEQEKADTNKNEPHLHEKKKMYG